MNLLHKDEYQTLVGILRKRYSFTRSDFFPIIGTLSHPIGKNVVSLYVDRNDLENVDFILLKIPVSSEIIEFIVNNKFLGNDGKLSSSAMNVIADNTFSNHFYLLWCHDCNKSLNQDLLSVVKSGSKFHKITDELGNALCKSGLDFKTIYSVKNVAINILQNENVFTKDIKDRELYYFDNITFGAFEKVVKQYYDEIRHKDLELSVITGLNMGAYCKSTKNLVGWVTLTCTGSIASLYVLDEHRRKGLGVDLVSYLVEKCSQLGIIPHGFSANTNSFLEKVGFTLFTDCTFIV